MSDDLKEVNLSEEEQQKLDNAPIVDDDNDAPVASQGDDLLDDENQEGEDQYDVDDMEPAEMEGFLKKKGDRGKILLWKKRYCRLYAPTEEHGPLVTYFKNQKDRKALGSIDLSGALAVSLTEKAGVFTITMKSTSRVWWLQGLKPEEADLWIDAIKKYINSEHSQEAVELDENVQGMVPAEPKRLRRDTAAEEPVKQPEDGDIAIVLWGSDLTYFQEVRQVTPDDKGKLTFDNLPVGLIEGTFSLKSHTTPELCVDQHTFRYDQKNAATLLARIPDETPLTVKAPRQLTLGNYSEIEFKGNLHKDHLSSTATILANHNNRLVSDASINLREHQKSTDNSDFVLVDGQTAHFLNSKELTSITINDDSINPSKLLSNAHLNVVLVDKNGEPAASNDELIEMSYVCSDAFAWHVEYNCILDPRETLMEFNGFHIVTNQTERDIENAKFVFLEAPEKEVGLKREKEEKKMAQEKQAIEEPSSFVDRVKGVGSRLRSLVPNALVATASLTMSALKGRLNIGPSYADRKRYVAPRLLSIAAGATTSLKIASSTSVPTTSAHLVRFGTPPFQRQAMLTKKFGSRALPYVESVVRFKNDQDSGIGVQLPAGLIHIYRRDKDGFGVERIASLPTNHSKVNEVVTVPVENLQMVRAKRIQTGFNFDQDKCIMIESFEIHLSSARQNPVELSIEDRAYRWQHYEVTATSHPMARETALPRTIAWNIRLGGAADPAASRKTIIRYTIMYSRFLVDTSLEDEKEYEKMLGADGSGRDWQMLAKTKTPAEPKK